VWLCAGAEFEVPYILVGDNVVVGDPFFVQAPVNAAAPQELDPSEHTMDEWRAKVQCRSSQSIRRWLTD
jgi:hypothetical protein